MGRCRSSDSKGAFQELGEAWLLQHEGNSLFLRTQKQHNTLHFRFSTPTSDNTQLT